MQSRTMDPRIKCGNIRPIALRLLFATLVLQGVAGLNFDTLSPTRVNSGVPNGNVIDFGFTLTQHEYIDGRKTVLVSATKADGEYEREGGVYSCPFENGGTCQFETVFQSKRNVRGDDLFVLQPSTLNISYIDQLMGYSLRSFNNHVVACAPLYIDTFVQEEEADGEPYLRGDPNGRCIILDRNLSETAPLQLFSKDVDSLRVAGVDTGVLVENDEEKLFFGNLFSGDRSIAKGQVFLTSLRAETLGTDVISSSGGSSSFLPYTGYHVDAGYFTTADTSGTKQIVTSAPRSDFHMGKVEFLTIGVTLVTDTDNTIYGQEADGYFGYDFAVVNFDPEVAGLDSLVVSCPLCNRERGRVYVYTHTGDISNPFTETVIEAPSNARGRFGLSVENIGDIDLDGIADVTISAPYEGSGVVYVYRGSPSGLVANDPQILQAEPGTLVFGYVLSGGADIDGNGYPDITVGDLSGDHVTSYRTSPLVNVTFDLDNRKEVLDVLGNSDRLCPLSENVNLQCFNVTPCFYFDSKFGDVTKFALRYSVVVDSAKSRAALYQVDEESREVSILDNTYSSTVMIAGPGMENRVCVRPLTFALSADFTETAPIPVQLSIDDVPDPLPLDSTPDSDQLGGALHPILRRYERGDKQLPLSLEYEINFNVECSGGESAVECEPVYNLDIKENFMSPLVLASANEFGYRVNVTNIAQDDGLSPSLVVQLPEGVLYNRSVSLSLSALTECNTRSIIDPLTSGFNTAVECSLRNPTLAGKTLELEMFFLLNVSAVSLEKSSLNIVFSVVDGATRNVSASATRNVTLEAVGDYGITSVVAEEKYQAHRGTIYRNATTIPLNETGPLISFRVVARNIREATNGTVFPKTTLLVHIPVEVSLVDGMRRPLLIPTSVVVTSGNVNCSHSEAIPQGLSIIQQPVGLIPPWMGPRPLMDSRCQREGLYRCGVILCTIVDLGPSPDPPTQLTIFARLYSPSVLFSGNLSIYSQLLNETELPRQGEDSVIESQVTFTFAPAVTETPRECVQYWVVVVSVVIGILALVVIISILACCGLFRRWYKAKKSEATNGTNGVEQTDSELFQRRTIPPIPGITQGGRGTAELTGYHPTNEEEDIEDEKEKEAEAERELQEEHADALSADEPHPQAGSPEVLSYDPAKGVDEEFEGEETEL